MLILFAFVKVDVQKRVLPSRKDLSPVLGKESQSPRFGNAFVWVGSNSCLGFVSVSQTQSRDINADTKCELTFDVAISLTRGAELIRSHVVATNRGWVGEWKLDLLKHRLMEKARANFGSMLDEVRLYAT